MKLFIDSATNYLYLAVVENDKAYAFSRMGKNDHSETLTNYLDDFLKSHEIKVEDITEIYVGRGPGSYTGLRIAGTVGKVFAFIKDLPFYSFSSLDLIACKGIDKPGKYKAIIRAKKNYSYIKTYDVLDEITIDTSDTCICDDELPKYSMYKDITVYDGFFDDGEKLALNILKYHLYREEDKYTYVPNYLRSELS